MGSWCQAWPHTTSPPPHHHLAAAEQQTGEMETSGRVSLVSLTLLLLLLIATAHPLNPAEEGPPLIRRKRFIDITGLVPTLFKASFFPTPFFPTNFIGLQVTLPAPKIKRRVRV